MIALQHSILRPWRQGDQTALVAYANNPLIWNNLRDSFPYPYTQQDADVWILLNEQKAQENPHFYYNFAIECGGEAVGGVGIIPQPDVYRLNAEVGYWLAQPFWGRGIATEALQAMTQYAFEQGGFRRLFANVFGFNKASCRVLEKAGYHLDAVFPGCILKNNTVGDGYLYGKLANF